MTDKKHWEVNVFNALIQKIGVWYKDKEWRDKIFKEIRENIPDEEILRCINGNNEMSIQLNDGSTIRMVSATDVSRGTAITRAYIQDGIGVKVYQTIIKPCIKPYFTCGIVVDKYEDFWYGGRLADRDYWIEKEKQSEHKGE